MYEQELAKAQTLIRDHGQNPDDYSFAMTYQEPDADGAGMFTVRYDIDIANGRTDKRLKLVGGIGLHWVDRFGEALADGHFD